MRRFELGDHAGSSRPWTVLLAGPVIWTAHFWFVYLLAEAACGPNIDRHPATGPTVLMVVVIASTAVGAGLTVAAGLRAYTLWRRGVDDGDEELQWMAGTGAVVAGFFVVAVLFVGVPAAVLPC